MGLLSGLVSVYSCSCWTAANSRNADRQRKRSIEPATTFVSSGSPLCVALAQQPGSSLVQVFALSDCISRGSSCVTDVHDDSTLDSIDPQENGIV